MRQLRQHAWPGSPPAGCKLTSVCVAPAWQVYSADGVTARGRPAILHRLQANAELREAYGHGAHEVDAIDPQTLDVRVINPSPP